MNKTSLKQKLLLIAFGVLLSLVTLEIALRLAGAVVLYLQERHNHEVSFASNEYRILCLGESTTALGGEDSYPSQLEHILNAQGLPVTYKVINKGIVSTTTNYILAHLEQNLDTYRPQMVVVMMGINDRVYLHQLSKNLWWENIKADLEDLRVYKLGDLLYQHISHRLKGDNGHAPAVNTADNDEFNEHVEDFLKALVVESIGRVRDHMALAQQYQSNGHPQSAERQKEMAEQSMTQAGLVCVELARRYRIQGLFDKAKALLEKAVVFAPREQAVYTEWGELYLFQDQADQALRGFQMAYTLAPRNSNVLLGLARAYHMEHNADAYFFYTQYLQVKPKDYWGYVELGRWLREGGQFAQAMNCLSRVIDLADFDEAYVEMGRTLDAMKEYKDEEDFYLKAIARHPGNSALYQALAQLYQRQGRQDAAREYFSKEARYQMPEYCPATLTNYKLLVQKVLGRHIKLVVMQYPLRDVSILKDYLAPYGERIVFVENKANFEPALTKRGYWYYFKDSFAHNFGHCTRAGNELIARNLAKVILEHE